MTCRIRLAGGLIALAALSFELACEKKAVVTNSGSETAKQLAPVSKEPGWAEYQMEAEGFTISLPPDWRQVDMDPKTFDRITSELVRQKPELRPMFASLRQQIAAGCKFFGFDLPSAKTGFATNVNVICFRLRPGDTLDSIVAENLAQMGGLSTISKPITHERIISSGGDRERLRYLLTVRSANGQDSTKSVTQYFLANGQNGFALTLVTLPDQSAKYTQVFEKIATSFRLIK